MSSIIEQAKAAAKVKAALLAGAKASLSTSAPIGQEDHPEEQAAPAEQAPAGGFKNLGLNQFFKADGTKIVPEKGYFIPKDAEEWDLLEYYSGQYNMVTGPKE